MTDIFADTPEYKQADETATAVDPQSFPQGGIKSYQIQKEAEFRLNTLAGQMEFFKPFISNNIQALQDYGIDVSGAIKPGSDELPNPYSVANYSPQATFQRELQFVQTQEDTIKNLQQKYPEDTRLKTWKESMQLMGEQAHIMQQREEANEEAQTFLGKIGGAFGSAVGFMKDPTNMMLTVASMLIPGAGVEAGALTKLLSMPLEEFTTGAITAASKTALNATLLNAGMLAVEAPVKYQNERAFITPDIKLPDFIKSQFEEAALGGIVGGGLHLGALGVAKIGSNLYRKLFVSGALDKAPQRVVDGLQTADDVTDIGERQPSYVDPVTHQRAALKAVDDISNGKEPDLSGIVKEAEPPIKPNPVMLDDELPIHDDGLDAVTLDRTANQAIDWLDKNPEHNYPVTLEFTDIDGTTHTIETNARDYLKASGQEITTLENILKCVRTT